MNDREKIQEIINKNHFQTWSILMQRFSCLDI